MDWSRVKSIMIIVFLLTNLFLISQIIQSRDSDKVPQELIEDAKLVLRQKNIDVKCPIPSTKGMVEKAAFSYGIDIDDFVRRVFGKEQIEQDVIEGSRFFVSVNKMLVVRGDTGIVQLNGRIDLPLERPRTEEEALDEAMGIIRKYGLDTHDYELEYITLQEDGSYALRFQGYYKKIAKVYNNFIKMSVSASRDIDLELFFSKPLRVPGDGPVVLPVTDILLGGLVPLLDSAEATVTGIELCYYLDPHTMTPSTGYQTAYLIWRITLDGDEENELLFNAHTASLIFGNLDTVPD